MDWRGVRAAARRVPGARAAALRARFGDLARTQPLTPWGYERGTPVDRWYLEAWLQQNASAVTGRVLEVKADQYSSSLGAAEVEVLDIDPGNPHADVVGDVCDPATVPQGRYDAAVVTQTLQFVDDPAAAVRNLLRGLRPGGALLLTVPCLSRLCDQSDRWRWTPPGISHLLSSVVPPGADVSVTGRGSTLAARAFLFGLAAEDLPAASLAVDDPSCPLVVCASVRVPR
jgi:SAM-dependent methyltransferase